MFCGSRYWNKLPLDNKEVASTILREGQIMFYILLIYKSINWTLVSTDKKHNLL